MKSYHSSPPDPIPTANSRLDAAVCLASDDNYLDSVENQSRRRAETQRFDNAFDGKLLFDPLIRAQAVYAHGVALGSIALFPSIDIFTKESTPYDFDREGC